MIIGKFAGLLYLGASTQNCKSTIPKFHISSQESNLVHAITSHLKTHGINGTNLYINVTRYVEVPARGNLSTCSLILR